MIFFCYILTMNVFITRHQIYALLLGTRIWMTPFRRNGKKAPVSSTLHPALLRCHHQRCRNVRRGLGVRRKDSERLQFVSLLKLFFVFNLLNAIAFVAVPYNGSLLFRSEHVLVAFQQRIERHLFVTFWYMMPTSYVKWFYWIMIWFLISFSLLLDGCENGDQKLPAFKVFGFEELKVSTSGFSVANIVSEQGEKAPNVIYKGQLKDDSGFIAIKRFNQFAWPNSCQFLVRLLVFCWDLCLFQMTFILVWS